MTSVLVDTSIWIDHLHRPVPDLIDLQGRSTVVVHPMIVGELALGNLAGRVAVLGALAGMKSIVVARHLDVMYLVEERSLFGRGLSLVDAHLIASALVSQDVAVWTRDKPMQAACEDLGVAYSP